MTCSLNGRVQTAGGAYYMGYYKNYINDEEYTVDSYVKFYKQNANGDVIGACGSQEEWALEAVKSNTSAGIMENSPGLIIPLGRGHPK